MTEPRSDGGNADLAAVLVGLVALDVAALAPGDPGPVRAAVVVAVLLAGPGYAATAALFPGRERDGLSAVGRLVLGVGASVGAVIAVGIALELAFEFAFRGVLVGVNGVTVCAVATALARRRRHDGETFGVTSAAVVARTRRFVAGSGRADLALSVALALCVVALLGSLYAIPADEGTGAEASLVTEQGDEFVASEYPTELAVGEATTLHLSVGDGREAVGEATVVVTLEELDDGTVSASREVDRFALELPDEEPVVAEHEVVPSTAGEELRLTYYVYFGDAPDEASPETADRQVHLQVTVSE